MNCVICKKAGDLVCFCSKSVFCSNCIGTHLIQDPTLRHNPVALSETSLTSPFLISRDALQIPEEDQYSEPYDNSKLPSLIQERLEAEIKEIDAFQSRSIKKVSEIVRVTERQLLSTAETLSMKIVNLCKSARKQLSEALEAVHTGDLHFNELTDYLSSASSPEALNKIKILEMSLEFRETNIESILVKAFSMDLEVISREPKRPEPRKNSVCPVVLFNDEQKYRTRIPGLRRLSSAMNSPARQKPPLLFWANSHELIEYNVNRGTKKTTRFNNTEIYCKGSLWTLGTDGNLYITGGSSNIPRNSCWIFNTKIGRFEQGPSMKTARFNHAAVSTQEFLYVIGGVNKNAIRECEQFSFTKRNWQKIASLNLPRETAGAVSHRSLLYVVGGAKRDSVETYNPNVGKFQLCKIKLPAPGKCVLVSYMDEIFVFQKGNVFNWDTNTQAMHQVANGQGDLWSPCSPYYCLDDCYFVAKGRVYSFKLSNYQLTRLDDLI